MSTVICRVVAIILFIPLVISESILAEEHGQITGQVFDKESGQPLSNANVVVTAKWNDDRKVPVKPPVGGSTDPGGTFQITNLSPGSYTLKVSFMGYAEAVRNRVEVDAGETTRINIALEFRAIKGKGVTVTANRHSRVADFSYVAVKLPLAIHKTPLSVDVVTQKVLQEQQATVLTDALENSISINVQKSLGTQDFFLIRGFDSNSAGLVLIDGISLPDASPFKFYGFGFHNLYNVEQVEVLKGPAAFLYGGNTLSGAVHLIRKNPRFANFGSVKISHSRYNSYQESLDMNYCDDDSAFAFRLNGLHQIDRKYRKHTRNNTLALNPALSWRPDNSSLMTVNIEYKHENLKPDVGIPLYNLDGEWQVPDVPNTSSYQTEFDKSLYDNTRLRIEYQRNLPGGGELKNTLFAHSLDGKSRFTLPLIPYRYSGISWTVPRNMYTIGQRQQIIGDQLELYQTWQTGQLKHNILMGVEGTYIDNFTVKQATEIKSVSLFDQREIVTRDFDELITFPRIETNTTQWILGMYLVDYVSLWEFLQVFGGSRIDYIDYYTDRRNASFDYIGRALSSDPVPFDQQFLKLSPMLGLVLKESENLWFYGNAGRAFASGERIVDEPEVSTQFEFGYRYRSDSKRIRNTVSLYSITKENMSIPLTGPLQGDVHASRGSQRVTGFEFQFVYQSKTDWFLSIENAYTYAEYLKFHALAATDAGKLTLRDFSGNVPLFVPNQIMYIKLYKDFKNGINFGTGYRYVSDQYAKYENDFEIERYGVYQTYLGYRLKNWTFQLNTSKISGNDLVSRGLGPYSVIPVVPLEFSGTIEASF